MRIDRSIIFEIRMQLTLMSLVTINRMCSVFTFDGTVFVNRSLGIDRQIENCSTLDFLKLLMQQYEIKRGRKHFYDQQK